MKSASRSLRMVLAGGVLAALVACASSGIKVSCDGKLTPINPPAEKVAAQRTPEHPSSEALP